MIPWHLWIDYSFLLSNYQLLGLRGVLSPYSLSYSVNEEAADACSMSEMCVMAAGRLDGSSSWNQLALSGLPPPHDQRGWASLSLLTVRYKLSLPLPPPPPPPHTHWDSSIRSLELIIYPALVSMPHGAGVESHEIIPIFHHMFVIS